MKTLNQKDIIRTIEEYRKAFWTHRNLQFVQQHRYSPVVGWQHISKYGNKPTYQVWLSDTWISMGRPGFFSLVQKEVAHSHFKSDTLDMALQELLNFCRAHFIDDKLFNKIQSLELSCQDKNVS